MGRRPKAKPCEVLGAEEPKEDRLTKKKEMQEFEAKESCLMCNGTGTDMYGEKCYCVYYGQQKGIQRAVRFLRMSEESDSLGEFGEHIRALLFEGALLLEISSYCAEQERRNHLQECFVIGPKGMLFGEDLREHVYSREMRRMRKIRALLCVIDRQFRSKSGIGLHMEHDSEDAECGTRNEKKQTEEE